MDVTQTLLEYARRPQGFSTDEVRGFEVHIIRRRADRMVENGTLFKAKISHKTVRFFDTAARAAECVRTTIPPQPKYPTSMIRGTKAGWAPDAPVHITSETKVTIAPAPPRALYSNTHSRW